MSNRTSLRMRVLPRYPARIVGTNGDKVERDGSSPDYVVSPAYERLDVITSLDNPSSTFVRVWNAEIGAYRGMTVTDLANEVGDLAVGPTLVSINGLDTEPDKGMYFIGPETAATYDLSLFVRGISGSADAAAFRDGLDLGSAALRDETYFAKPGDIPIYETKAGMGAIEIPASIDTVRVNGSVAANDGLGGLYVDTNNGSTDTFVSGGATTRTWYRAADVGVSRLSAETVNYVAGSGVLDVRSVFRVEGEKRGTASIASGSNQLTFAFIDLKKGDHIWLSGAAASTAKYKVQYDILASPLQSRTLFIVCDGFIFNSNHVSGGIPVLSTDTPTQVATKIRAGAWAGWTVGGSGTTVTLERNAPGATVGAHWSDVDFAIIPKNETLLQEGVGVMQAKVLSVSGSIATLDVNATGSVTDAIVYRDTGRAVKLAMDADPTIKEVVVPQGFFFWSDGVRFPADGGRFRGEALSRTTIYPLPSSSPLVEFRNSASGVAILGVNVEDMTISLQNVRRHGVFMSRIWDGSGGRRVLINGIAPGYMGLRIGRDPTAPPPASANDQSVVSQSVTLENFHVSRTNPSQNDSTPAFYQEFVQEGTYLNVKALGGTDINGHGSTVATRLEGCRGLKFVGSSFAFADEGVRITSTEGAVEGITFITPTLETNTKAVIAAGGAYDIDDITVTSPRIIGAGNKFVINRCQRGLFESQDRNVEIAGAVRKNVIITDDPTLITDADGAGANPVISNRKGSGLQSYYNNFFGHEFWTGSVMGESIKYPANNTETAMVLATNRAGVVTAKQVYEGPPDSAGTGRRALYIPN